MEAAFISVSRWSATPPKEGASVCVSVAAYAHAQRNYGRNGTVGGKIQMWRVCWPLEILGAGDISDREAISLSICLPFNGHFIQVVRMAPSLGVSVRRWGGNVKSAMDMMLQVADADGWSLWKTQKRYFCDTLCWQTLI